MLGAAINLFRGARVGYVLAREGALALVDPSELPPHLRLALQDRALPGAGGPRRRGRPALGGADPARSLLREVRPVPGDPAGHRRHAGGVRPGEAAGPGAAVPAGDRPAGRRGGPRQAGARRCSSRSASRSPRPRSRRSTRRSCRIPTARSASLAVKVMRPGVRERFMRDLEVMRFMARVVNALSPQAERLRPREVVEILARSVDDGDGLPAGGGGRLRAGRRTPGTTPISACRSPNGN